MPKMRVTNLAKKMVSSDFIFLARDKSILDQKLNTNSLKIFF